MVRTTRRQLAATVTLVLLAAFGAAPAAATPAAATPTAATRPVASARPAVTVPAPVAGSMVALPPTLVYSNGDSSLYVPAGGEYTLTLAGQAGIPRSGIGAVLLRISVSRAAAGGYVTVYPNGHARPATSNLNFGAGDSLGTTVLTKLGAGGAVQLFNSSSRGVRLYADALGYTLPGTATAPGTLTGVPPARVFDSAARPVPAHGSITFAVGGHGGVPASGAGAVALTLTAAAGQRTGYLTAYAAGGARPPTSTVNFTAGRAVPNFTVAELGTGGAITVYNGSSGSVRVIADVAGWYRPGTAVDPGGLTAITPARILDTGSGSAILAPQQTVPVPVAGRGGVPASAGAVIVNVTAASPPAQGGLEAGDVGLGFPAARSTAAGTLVRLQPDGSFALTNQSASPVRVVVDVIGWVARRPASATFGATQPIPSATFTDIDCPSATFCLAVREDGAAYAFDGTTWTAAGTTGLTGFEAYNGTPLVSCISATSCVAISTDRHTSAYNGSTWTTPTKLAGSGGSLVALSCSAAGYCIAVVATTPELLRWDGTSWSTVAAVDDDLYEVACAPGGFCLATSESSTYVSDDGTTWTQRRGDLANLRFGTTGLACTSATACLAVTADGAHPGRAAVFDGSTWRIVSRADSVYYPSVSCASATLCLAIGETGAGTAGGSRFDGTSFTAAPTFVTGRSIVISCGAPSTCVALSTDGYANVFDGTSWSAASPIEPRLGNPYGVSCTGGRRCVVVTDGGWEITYVDGTMTGRAPVGQRKYLGGVSCGSTDLCVAIAFDGRAVRFGADGAGAVQVQLAPTLTGVSCAPDTSFCVALDSTHGTAYTLSGTTWSGPVVVSGAHPPNAVSCVAVSSCLAIGNGYAYRLGTNGWSAGATTPANAGLSCATITYCLSGYYFYDGSTWTRTGLDGNVDAGCTPGGSCVAVGTHGVTTFAHGVWSDPIAAPEGSVGAGVSCSSDEYCAVDAGHGVAFATP